MEGRKSSKLNRRKVLSGISGLSASALGASKIGSVAAKGQKQEFAGVAYDPQSGQEIGTASARINRNGQLVGDLNLPDKKIPLAIGAPSDQYNYPTLKGTATRYRTNKGGKYSRDKKPLRVTVTSVEQGDLSGIVRHPGYEKKAVAFRVKPKGSRTKTNTVDEVRDQRSGV